MLTKINSGYRKKDDIAPQSDYIFVHDSGWCLWEPLFLWSRSQCPMDTTWFPFDEQRCSLAYESWKYNSDEVNFIEFKEDNMSSIEAYDFDPNGLWELVGKTLLIVDL